jgi:hypothetical protein
MVISHSLVLGTIAVFVSMRSVLWTNIEDVGTRLELTLFLWFHVYVVITIPCS